MNPRVRGTVGLGGMGRLSMFWGREVRMIDHKTQQAAEMCSREKHGRRELYLGGVEWGAGWACRPLWKIFYLKRSTLLFSLKRSSLS